MSDYAGRGGGGLRRDQIGEAAEGWVVPSCTFENTSTCVTRPVKLF